MRAKRAFSCVTRQNGRSFDEKQQETWHIPRRLHSSSDNHQTRQLNLYEIRIRYTLLHVEFPTENHLSHEIWLSIHIYTYININFCMTMLIRKRLYSLHNDIYWNLSVLTGKHEANQRKYERVHAKRALLQVYFCLWLYKLHVMCVFVCVSSTTCWILFVADWLSTSKTRVRWCWTKVHYKYLDICEIKHMQSRFIRLKYAVAQNAIKIHSHRLLWWSLF